jgi:hypothetical protein
VLAAPTAYTATPYMVALNLPGTPNTLISTASAHGLLSGSTFYFTSIGVTIGTSIATGTLYYVCSVPSKVSFTATSASGCSGTALSFSAATTQPVIGVPASFSASKNSNAYSSSAAGSGYLNSAMGGFKGYRLSVARVSGRGWNTAANDQWLPKNKWYASDVYMTSWNDVPRSVALTNVNMGMGSIHSNQVFYATGYNANSISTASDFNNKNAFAAVSGTSAALPNGAGGSIRGRCFKGVSDYVANNYDLSSGTYPYVGMSTADLTCAFSEDFVD